MWDDVLVAKIVSILVIFGGSLFCGLLPAFRIFASFPRFYLSLILSFGGGILIATSLVHILPESREGWPKSIFTCEMTLCLGIFLVYIVEEIAHFLVCHDLHSPLSHPGEGDGHNHGVHVHHDEPPNRCEEPAAVFLFAEEKTRSGEHGQGLNSNNTRGRCHSHGHGGHGHSHGGHGHSHSHGHGDDATVTTKLFEDSTPKPVVIAKASPAKVLTPGGDEHVDGAGSSKEDRRATVVARLRSLVGLIALSIHAGLEGLAVGLGQNYTDVVTLCMAVSAHKFVIAFCLGMEVRNASANVCSLVAPTSSSSSFKFRYVLFFALMTPLGILIGTGITEVVATPADGTESGLVAVLQALAAGTLLYVAFFEVILRERVRFSGKGLMQLAFVILGWATMVGVEIMFGDHHHGPAPGQGHAGHSHDNHTGHDHGHDHDDLLNFTTTTPVPSSYLISS
jgi:zinc transporter 1/2/3